MICLGIEARRAEKLIADHGARVRFRKRFSEAGIDFNVDRQQPIVGINYQNVFDFSVRGCQRANRRKTEDKRGKGKLPNCTPTPLGASTDAIVSVQPTVRHRAPLVDKGALSFFATTQTPNSSVCQFVELAGYGRRSAALAVAQVT